jgi:hypothetical protein
MLCLMNEHIPILRLDGPATYCIKVQGCIDASWADWFGAATINTSHAAGRPPVTMMVGELVDQAALFGWLSRLRDLGLPLLLVECLFAGREKPEDI